MIFVGAAVGFLIEGLANVLLYTPTIVVSGLILLFLMKKLHLHL